MPVIPDVLKALSDDIKYIRLRPGTQNPVEKKWALDGKWTEWAGYAYDDPIITEWINAGNNYGFRPVGGGLCVFDCDDTLYDPALVDLFKDTLTFRTGSGGYHFIFRSPGLEVNKKFILTASDGTHIGHISTAGFKFQYVGPTCIHPNGNAYSVFRDNQVQEIDAELINQQIKSYIKNTKKIHDKISGDIPEYIKDGKKSNYTDILGLRIEDIGFPDGNVVQIGHEYKGSHPVHGSTTGSNYTINPPKNVWFCFRDHVGGDPFIFIAVKHGIISCSSVDSGCMEDPGVMNKTLHIIRIGGEGKYLSEKLIAYEEEEKRKYFEDKSNELESVDMSVLLKSIRKNQTVKKTTGDSTLPEYILSIPGVLQHVVEYYNRTATKKQPQFAVQTAIALGSVILGRKYFTNEQNGTNIYLLSVAKSSAGKEHIKTVIETILNESGCDKLIGPGGYTSSGAVMHWLMKKPNHITIMDELGRDLEAVGKASNSNAMDMITALMKLYSKQMSIYSGIGYSDRNNKRRADEDDTEIVKHPAITICGMTTPSTLYGAMTSSYITNGFLPRLIVCEAIYGRQPSKRRDSITWSIPSELIQWCRFHQNQQEGNIPIGPEFPPNPIIIPISDAAYDLYADYELEYMKLQDANESMGIDAMWGRCRENAMRLGLIAALSCNSMSVEAGHAEWAISYIRYYSEQTIKSIKSSISDSPFEAVVKSAYEIIQRAGPDGFSESEIIKRSRKLQGIEPKRRMEVFKSLIDTGHIIIPETDTSKPGKHTIKYVAVSQSD
jgi:hypothetical protein